MTNLILYYKPTCGYCLKVLRFISDKQIAVELRNISESSDLLRELVERTGNTQVPCLIHDGEITYESDDIIEWLNENGEHK